MRSAGDEADTARAANSKVSGNIGLLDAVAGGGHAVGGDMYLAARKQARRANLTVNIHSRVVAAAAGRHRRVCSLELKSRGKQAHRRCITCP